MKKLSRTADLLVRLLRIPLCFLMAKCALSALELIYLGLELANEGATLVPPLESHPVFGSLKLVLSQEYIPNLPGWLQPARAALEVAYMPVYILMYLALHKTMQPFIEERPFQAEVAQGLDRLGVLLVIHTALDGVRGWLQQTIAGYYDLPGLFLSEHITDVSLGRGFSWTPLLFSGGLFLLAMVFRYGQELQALSDETL